jgi:hypothetical protein
MKLGILWPPFAALATASCLHEYHPEYHPEIWQKYEQNVSYPVTIVQSGTVNPTPAADGGRADASVSTGRLAKPTELRERANAPPPGSLAVPARSVSPPERSVAAACAAPPSPPHDPLVSQVSATRLGLPAFARPSSCELELIDSSPFNALRYEQVGLVSVMQTPYGTQPLDDDVRDVVRPKACELGGTHVALASSGDVVPPTAPSYASSYAIFYVYREKSWDDLIAAVLR